MKAIRYIKLRTYTRGPIDLIFERSNNPLKQSMAIRNLSHNSTRDFLAQFQTPVDLINAGSNTWVTFVLQSVSVERYMLFQPLNRRCRQRMARLERFNNGLRLPSRIQPITTTMGIGKSSCNFSCTRSCWGFLILAEFVNTLQFWNAFRSRVFRQCCHDKIDWYVNLSDGTAPGST